MNLLTVISRLESNLTREVTHIKKYNDSISYTNPNNNIIRINQVAMTPYRICLLTKPDDYIYLYVNTLEKKYHKLKINEITAIQWG